METIESLVQERVVQLRAVAQRRNELLRQMYYMMRQRHRAGSIMDELDQVEDDTDGLHEFMDRFDLDKNPESGMVSNLSEDDLFVPFLLPSDTEQDASGDDDVDVDSPMSEPPASPRPRSLMEVDEPEVEMVSMTVSPPPTTPSSVSRKRPMEEEEEEEAEEEEEEEEEEEYRPDDHKISPSRSPSRHISPQPNQSVPHRSPSQPSLHPVPSPEPPIIGDTEGEEVVLVEAVETPQVAREPSPRSISPSSFILDHKEPEPQQPMIIHTAVDVATLHPALLIPTPTSPALTAPVFSFESSEPEPTADSPSTPVQAEISRHHFSPDYTLPPPKFLPPNFVRKGKSSKQRKRDKDRAESKTKEEWTPLGFVKWGASIRANPIHKKVSRAAKCLSTRDWGVAITELRLMRTLERVESLENIAKWSYRQPKKQRNLGGMTKTHWDYLLDEMKWMRVDFREERRWKYVLAFNLSTAVLEWHAAGTPEERIKQGICMHWKRPRTTTDHRTSQDMDVDGRPSERREDDSTVTGDDSDNEDDDAEAEQREVVDSLETGKVLEEALESRGSNSSEDSSLRQSPVLESVRPKVEDVEDSAALQAANAGGVASEPAGDDGQKAKMETAEPQGLKPSSTDPLLGSSPDSQRETAQASSSAKAATVKSNLYVPLRERIAYSDERKLFIENEDLDLVKDFSALTTDDQALEPSCPPPDLSVIFPDLQPLGIPDVVNAMAEGKEKADKKTEREGSKRVDDSGYTKMAPMGKFMMCKPVLLGPLHPARRWKNGHWVDPEEPAVTEAEGSGRISDDSLSGEWLDCARLVLAPQPPKDTKKRAEHAWSPEEDALLKRLADKYPNNWSLITDVFNSSRVAIPFDKRMPWECFERWNTKFGGIRYGPSHPEVNSPAAAAAEGTPPPIASSTSQAQMTTRGVKRLASTSISQNQNTGLISSDMLKRRRHTLIYETIRKVAKKREITQKASMNQRKSSNIHDTHSQYNKMPKMSPAELSRLKADKETREHQEMLMARRRHDEMTRQQQLRMQAAAQGQAPAAAAAPAAQPQQANGATRAVQQPAQAVPQIRAQPVPQVNISQQQRMPTPMASTAVAVAAARMSPQMLQAQVAQARALAAVAAQSQAQAQLQAQVQAQGQGQVPVQVPTPAQNAGVNNVQNSLPVGAHLSPPYQSRAATSSPGVVPQGSPPHNGITLSNAASPILTSTQPQMQIQGGQVPGNAIPRPPGGLPAHYFPVVATAGGHFTQEQVDQAMRIMQQQRTNLGQPQQGSQFPSQS
ncbi:hypothetical protein BKA82DRAFT_15598 [Pisolithus tinctorius]|uniref:Vacuolar import and degradation protein 21 n=1 Tax=Pisolithus tinctorius Marx 270 TaxID=870435 RepID=A0A0C3J4T0_PISTI|nr:hypothetical protein BKA82DRAFT_15598 [Pisolithus tinctorius]KIO04093.1 hypothetical protein M404DRAFT_15598 [Pisolithus tinctorius Marx 270]